MSRCLALVSLVCLLAACQVGGGDDGASSGIPSTGGEDPTLTGESSGDSMTSSTAPSTTTDPTDTDTDTAGDNYCLHQCQSDADCLSNGMDLGLACVDSLCQGGASSCTSDPECVAFLSGWTVGMACTSGGGECDAAMQVCLDIEGEGHCAVAPSEFIDCVGIGRDEIPTTDIDGNPVVVCGRANAACHEDGYCHLPCESDNDCAGEAYPSCNVGTGLCECSVDADCQTLGSPQYSVCNSGVCGCDGDDDCLAGGVGDVCTGAGQCGCTSDQACAGVTNPYDGGAVECVML